MTETHYAYDAPSPKRGLASIAVLAGFLALCIGTGFAGSILTTPNLAPWYADLVKPVFTPPDWIFAPVWTTLFILMAIAAWLVWRAPVANHLKMVPLLLFIGHLAVNIGWSAAFFGLQNPAAGLAVIAVLAAFVLVIAVRFARIVPLAGLLIVPYVLWVGFASVLNGAIWWLNR